MLQSIGSKSSEEINSSTPAGDRIDHIYRSMIAEMTNGLSPITPALLTINWLLNLGTSPGKLMALSQLAHNNATRFYLEGIGAALGVGFLKNEGGKERQTTGQQHDRRFPSEDWHSPPFSLYKNLFLSTEQWWQEATTDISGMPLWEQKSLSFQVNQLMNVYSPSNFLLTNPDVLNETLDKGGLNLVEGFNNLVDDMFSNHEPVDQVRSKYKVGENLAVSPGVVVYRNDLMELIQYQPSTKTVHPEPLLIVPAWIMKYYILDLRPQNSLVRYLTSMGFTVFMISWRNPGEGFADYSLDDYRQQGPMAALDAIEAITGLEQIHAAGYCLGGTLLSIAAADMARKGDERLKSLTLLAAQTDFSEAGEITLFINESHVAFLEDMMKQHGVLDGDQMAGAFKLLRANDLIWQRWQQDYLMGTRGAANDMMAWNADATRMPYKMHSEYLRKLFLNNELAREKLVVDGQIISLRDLTLPIFAVGTETDHVAPWKSVFKIHSLSHADVTFTLTRGGHNAGIVSEPGHPRRHYHIYRTKDHDPYLAPEAWLDLSTLKEGSWWPEWCRWLARRSSKKQMPPKTGAALCKAPGQYVMEV